MRAFRISPPPKLRPVAPVLLAAAALAGLQARAQQAAVAMEPVVVSATRGESRQFDAPAAIDSVDADQIREAGAQVNLSEVLDRVPGLTVLNRQNYAQDLQLSIRGFGSRSTFGIRGVRLIVDGIPATMPDGQGQASTVSLGSASRIEVLRGPLALLYGNAAGGVVQVFTEAGAARPTLEISAAAMPYGAHREEARYASGPGDQRYTVDVSRFATEGYREHSAAMREQLNAKWTSQWSAATRVDFVVNVFDQPLALDPLGLTRAQWQANPRQAPAAAFTQDASKEVRQKQAGVVLVHELDADTTLNARAYLGQRNLDNALSTPLAAQLPPTSSGGIVSFDRTYAGVGLQLERRVRLGDWASARLLAGVDHDRMVDDRQGYLNVSGVRGELRRDEDDRVANLDALLQASLDVGEHWSALAGVRSSRVRFDTRDRYIVPGNPDDSGTLDYRATNPVVGVSWHATPALNIYANAGRGFETPTFTELAYRNGASGLNTDLRAARSRDAEVGAKWRWNARHALDLAVFDVRTEGELVVDTNVGGRSTFRNAGRTSRRGAELSWRARWTDELQASIALTALRARFDDGFTSGSGDAAVAIAAGNRMPGTPERNAFAELAYTPRWGPAGFNAGVEVAHVGSIAVNDANSDSAPAVTLVNLRVGWRARLGPWEVEPRIRLENATNRRYAGSVIVNESQQRYFEPAPPRTWLVAVSARYRF